MKNYSYSRNKSHYEIPIIKLEDIFKQEIPYLYTHIFIKKLSHL